ncbi:alpha/beta hydrolase [uncultured Parasphingorhabdus sp.]|uniref:alpha/beta fold hydrolase n=1 Tax=uncultured Parasphingorhabdus sp. TaxID=2709694 RepID=UPI0030D76005
MPNIRWSLKMTLACSTVAILVGLPACSAAQSAQPAASASTAAASQEARPRLTIEELRKLYADEESRYMEIGGVEVHYKDEGSGPVLFMVHGSVSSTRTWDRITEILKPDYRIIRFDIPGYGLSGRVSDEAAANVQPVEIAEQLAERLGVKKLTFVGVSSGGTMGMYLAAKRPDLVERLIISNTPSDPVDTSHLVMPESFVSATKKSRETGYSDMSFWNEYLSFFAGDPDRISEQTRKEYYDFNRRTAEKHPIALVARIGDGVQAKIEMQKITAPTFLIWGGADPLLPESAADAITGYLGSAQISRVIMPDVGHYPPLESPDRFAQLIAAYVEAGVISDDDPETAKP